MSVKGFGHRSSQSKNSSSISFTLCLWIFMSWNYVYSQNLVKCFSFHRIVPWKTQIINLIKHWINEILKVERWKYAKHSNLHHLHTNKKFHKCFTRTHKLKVTKLNSYRVPTSIFEWKLKTQITQYGEFVVEEWQRVWRWTPFQEMNEPIYGCVEVVVGTL